MPDETLVYRGDLSVYEYHLGALYTMYVRADGTRCAGISFTVSLLIR